MLNGGSGCSIRQEEIVRNTSNSLYGSKLAVVESSVLGNEEELREAARALVEAASWGQYARSGQFIGEQTKQELIDSVVSNPLVVEQLFTKEGLNLH